MARVSDENPTSQELVQHEDELIDGLLAWADQRDAIAVAEVRIPRILLPQPNGARPFGFRVRGLHDSERADCARQAQRRKPNARFANLSTADERDDARYNSLLILTATVEEDQAIWRSKRLQSKYGVASPQDLIEALLLAGEKTLAINQIWTLSGFTAEQEELALD